MTHELATDKTILYITDNSLDYALFEKCRELLLKSADGLPIVSVSQKPIALGTNICVGDIGRSAISLSTQLLVGLESIDTKWVSMAEHDCVYSDEHFKYIPPSDKFIWYNTNNWFAQYYHPTLHALKGMYSTVRKRFALSQLVADSCLFRESALLRHSIMSSGGWIKKYKFGKIGELGVANINQGADHIEKARLFMSKTKKTYPKEDASVLEKQLVDYFCKYTAKEFRTNTPNLDIRHKNNFTGQRRGVNRTYHLPPWGRLEDVLGALP